MCRIDASIYNRLSSVSRPRPLASSHSSHEEMARILTVEGGYPVTVKNIAFIGGYSSSHGGCMLLFEPKLPTVLSAVTFDQCTSVEGGGGLSIEPYDISYDPSALYNEDLSTSDKLPVVTMDATTFSRCVSPLGGGVEVLPRYPMFQAPKAYMPVRIEIKNSKFVHCIASKRTIIPDDGSGEETDEAGSRGGAILVYQQPTILNIQSSTFDSCTSDYLGGAIHTDVNENFILCSHSESPNCSPDPVPTSIQIVDTTFFRCGAACLGGAHYARSVHVPSYSVVTGSTFQECYVDPASFGISANDCGGGVDNDAGLEGGAIFSSCELARVQANSTLFQDNQAHRGSAVCLNGVASDLNATEIAATLEEGLPLSGAAEFSSCTFNSSYSTEGGGSLFYRYRSLYVADTVFVGGPSVPTESTTSESLYCYEKMDPQHRPAWSLGHECDGSVGMNGISSNNDFMTLLSDPDVGVCATIVNNPENNFTEACAITASDDASEEYEVCVADQTKPCGYLAKALVVPLVVLQDAGTRESNEKFKEDTPEAPSPHPFSAPVVAIAAAGLGVVLLIAGVVLLLRRRRRMAIKSDYNGSVSTSAASEVGDYVRVSQDDSERSVGIASEAQDSQLGDSVSRFSSSLMGTIHEFWPSSTRNATFSNYTASMLQLTDMFASEAVAPSWEEVVNRVVKDFPRLEVVDEGEFTQKQEIGFGATKRIVRAQWGSADVAIAFLRNDATESMIDSHGEDRLKELHGFAHEIAILSQSMAPNVVAVYGITKHNPGYIMEFMRGGSLRSLVARRPGKFSLRTNRRFILSILKQIAIGLSYLHSKHIIHFDVKAENVLFEMRGSRPVVKIADMGLSKRLLKSRLTGNAVGTLPWMAPELLQTESVHATYKVDIYSFAILCWELVAHASPYTGVSDFELIQLVLRGERPSLAAVADEELRQLMEWCWAPNPEDRPSAEQVVSYISDLMDREPGSRPQEQGHLTRFEALSASPASAQATLRSSGHHPQRTSSPWYLEDCRAQLREDPGR
mmetsp:Transcript_1750/g.6173  ORF Transcript_1750/g.6173 Transcript_1750/m.6173 type:complete len:1024 (+) Transcript_1750:287-3358(+)